MGNNPFEKLISQLLRGHDYADKLRALSSKEGELEGALNFLFLEAEFDSYIYEGRIDADKQNQVRSKLIALKELIRNSYGKPDYDKHVMVIDLLLDAVDNNKVFDKQVFEYLNKLNIYYK